jgi:RNA polymerase sigma-70 factor (ECF subfamily)
LRGIKRTVWVCRTVARKVAATTASRKRLAQNADDTDHPSEDQRVIAALPLSSSFASFAKGTWNRREASWKRGGGGAVYDMRPAGDNRWQTEAQLIAGIRAGDRTAFEIVYRTYYPQLVAFAQRHGACSKPDAKEIGQEIFLSIWRNRNTWDVRSGLEAYLFGAVRNRVRRACRFRPPQELRATTRTSVDNSGEHRPIISELTATINAIVSDMPTRCRDIYHLHHTEGLNTRAIAKALDLAIPTVKRHHARALHLLARGLAATEWADVARRVLDGTTYGALEHDHDDT